MDNNYTNHHSNSKEVEHGKHPSKNKTSSPSSRTNQRTKKIKHKNRHPKSNGSESTKSITTTPLYTAYPVFNVAHHNSSYLGFSSATDGGFSDVLLPAAATSTPATAAATADQQTQSPYSPASSSDTAATNVDLLAPLLAAVGAVAALALLIMICFTFCRSTSKKNKIQQQKGGNEKNLRGWGVRQSWLSTYSGGSVPVERSASTPSTLPPPYDELKVPHAPLSNNSRPSTPTKSMQYTPMLAYSPSCMSQQSWHMPSATDQKQ